MERKFYLFLAIFISTVGVWFYLSLNLGIDWTNPRAYNAKTGAKINPKDIDRYASKFLNYTREYVNKTSAEERLYDLLALINLETLFFVDQTYGKQEDLIRSGWPVSNQTSCGKHLSWIHNQLKENRKYTFLKGELGEQLTDMMDSYGRPEPGFYHSGIAHWVGAYEQCLGVHFRKEQIRGRYCVVEMRPEWWPQNETIYPQPAVRVGICLPETCDTMSLDVGHKEAIEKLTKYQLDEFFRDGYDLTSMYCLPDERSPLRQLPQSGYAFFIVYGFWFSLVIVATLVYELYYREKRSTMLAKISNGDDSNINQQVATQLMIESNKQPEQSHSSLRKFCQALSLRRSLKTFKTRAFAVDYSRGQRVRVDLGCLDFFKCFMTVFVALGHSGWLMVNLTRSPGHSVELSRHKVSHWGMGITLYVDTFFIIFGLLFTYNLMKKLRRPQLGEPLVWLGVITRIFIRITPIYMFIHWWAASVSPYAESGPLWDYGTGSQSLRSMCFKEHWWYIMPLFSALKKHPWSNCLPTAWFVVSYLQIGFILPLLTYILCKLPNHFCRLLFTACSILVSMVYTSIQVYKAETIPLEKFFVHGSLFTNISEKFEVSGYMMAIGRFGSVCVGCCVGCLLRLYEEGIIASWPKWLQRKSTLVLAFITILNVGGGPVLLYVLTTYNLPVLGKLAGVIMNQFRLLAWYISNAIMFISLSTSLNKTGIARFCAHNFWHSFNKLGLVIYLLHWEILYILMTSWERAAPYGLVRDIYRYGFVALVYSIFLGGILYLFIEVPAGNLMTRLDDYLAKPRRPKELGNGQQHQTNETYKMKSEEC